jgi:hypothetical protein
MSFEAFASTDWTDQDCQQRGCRERATRAVYPTPEAYVVNEILGPPLKFYCLKHAIAAKKILEDKYIFQKELERQEEIRKEVKRQEELKLTLKKELEQKNPIGRRARRRTQMEQQEFNAMLRRAAAEKEKEYTIKQQRTKERLDNERAIKAAHKELLIANKEKERTIRDLERATKELERTTARVLQTSTESAVSALSAVPIL